MAFSKNAERTVPSNKNIGHLLTRVIFVLVMVIALGSCKKEVSDSASNTSPLFSPKYQELHVDVRKLWAEHMEWTDATVDAFFHDQPGLDAKLNRLLQNQQDIGTAIKPYFGEEAGNKLTDLLTEHIQLAVPVLTAAQEANDEALEEALDNWYANAQQVGDHFAVINAEAWEQSVLRDMWKVHITQTVDYSVALLTNHLDDAIVLYQTAYDHMMGMGDIMAEGIAQKSPSSFIR